MRKLLLVPRLALATLLVAVLQGGCSGQSTGSQHAGGSSGDGAGSSQGGTAEAGTGHGGTVSTGGTGPSPTACQLPSDCTVGPAICCGVCDGPELSKTQLVAYNRQYATQYLCGGGIGAKTLPYNPPGDPGSGASAPIGCPACPALSLGQGTLKYFVPDCVQGECVVSDLRESPLTACSSNADCRLRSGTACCEGCGGVDPWVAVRSDGSFEKSACSAGPQPCLACLPEQPVNLFAYCADTGHCEVAYPHPTTE